MTYIFLVYFLTTVFIALSVVLLLELLVYGLSLLLKRNDIADVAWPICFVTVIVTFFFLLNNTLFQYKILLVLIMLWGIRLTYHIGRRFFEHKKEDGRYASFRKQWTWIKTRSFFQVYLLQGILAVVVLSPVLAYIAAPGLTHWWKIYLGIALWVVGFVFQVVADWQLEQFMRRPSRYKLKKGNLMTKGVWALSRHPNYFGEMSMWWGIWFICFYTAHPAYLITSIIGPITITTLLLFVSGVRMTENRWKISHPDELAEYKKTTPVIIPFVPDWVWEQPYEWACNQYKNYKSKKS